MAYELRKVEPPSDDKRWKIIQSTMRRNGFTPHSLIEVLHGVQGVFGYLDMDSLRYVAQSLKVPLSKAYGVATFYHFFTLKPQGKHTCVVCMGTACFIKGANQVLDAVKENFGVVLPEELLQNFDLNARLGFRKTHRVLVNPLLEFTI